MITVLGLIKHGVHKIPCQFAKTTSLRERKLISIFFMHAETKLNGSRFASKRNQRTLIAVLHQNCLFEAIFL
jgi:hypothetical protein